MDVWFAGWGTNAEFLRATASDDGAAMLRMIANNTAVPPDGCMRDAIRARRPDIVLALVRHGGCGLHRALVFACLYGRGACADVLLRSGAAVRAAPESAYDAVPALSAAVVGRWVPVVLLLLSHGADPTAEDSLGRSALTVAKVSHDRLTPGGRQAAWVIWYALWATYNDALCPIRFCARFRLYGRLHTLLSADRIPVTALRKALADATSEQYISPCAQTTDLLKRRLLPWSPERHILHPFATVRAGIPPLLSVAARCSPELPHLPREMWLLICEHYAGFGAH